MSFRAMLTVPFWSLAVLLAAKRGKLYIAKSFYYDTLMVKYVSDYVLYIILGF